MGSYNYYRVFGCFKRKFKIRELEAPPDVREAFRRYGGGADQMTAAQLLKFLVEYQGEEGSTAADAEAIMHKVLRRRHHMGQRYGFTLDDFFEFLFQDELNGPINPKVHHDMNAPLQHYFIYTGHNSYLTGNQLNSNCSEIPIIKALENGVRGIELDLWPNSAKDDINVLHGRTMTAPVPLMRCLESIKKHAFDKSPYPVIITLEDHLTPHLQAKVATMVTQVFGEMLYCPKSDSLEQFPSPEELKHRIILSTKPPKEYLQEGSNINNKDEQTLPPLQDNDSSEDEQLLRETSAEPEDDYKSESDEDDEDNQQKSGNVGGEAPEYKRLIGIHAGGAKKGLRHALRNASHKVSRLSLSEQGLQRAADLYATDVIRFTQKNILRVYPKGTRVTSSNFRPITGWMHGAQMVAFNMQILGTPAKLMTWRHQPYIWRLHLINLGGWQFLEKKLISRGGHGKSLRMMHGLFRSNGGCGYVKKPDLVMTRGPNNDVFDPRLRLPVKKILKVSVYMGDGWRLDFSHTHFDSYSPPDFYTKIYITGVAADVAKKKTKVIGDEWTPYWDEDFSFPLTVPELALLRIEVKEYDRSEKDDFGGQTCFPVSELRPGIRAVPLYDKKGQKFKSVRLLMRFHFE